MTHGMSHKNDAHQGSQGHGRAVASPLPQLAPDELQPSDRERQLLLDLFEWEERSRKTHWVLGEPLGMRT